MNAVIALVTAKIGAVPIKFCLRELFIFTLHQVVSHYFGLRIIWLLALHMFDVVLYNLATIYVVVQHQFE